ncbi:MAG: hypothetical protein M0C28_25395 [Candidatus Moduliflexus flocculans]|nr:hypothetical protein [Candidatus Moduliflexus flocculans]
MRELIQALEKALISAKEEPILFPKHLPTYIRILGGPELVTREDRPSQVRAGPESVERFREHLPN